MEDKKHRRLTLKERVQIETLLQQNKTKAYIAKTINRSRSTVSREVNKLGSNPKVDYDAYLAHWSAKEVYLNKRNFDKISTFKQLRIYVFRGLLLNWTPEQIASLLRERKMCQIILS